MYWLLFSATTYFAGRSGDRIPVLARFFAHVQTGRGAHPASCTLGTGSFPGVKRPGRGVDHPPPSSAEVRKEYPPHLGLRACYGVPLPTSYFGCRRQQSSGRHRFAKGVLFLRTDAYLIIADVYSRNMK
jgi:hypothetical protein